MPPHSSKAKFPEPPGIEALREIPVETQTLAAGTTVARLFFAAGDYPSTWDAFRHYGPSASRFDHHLPDDDGLPQVQERGVMYLAAGSESIPTCLAEVFQATRIIDRYSRDPILAGFELRGSLTLLSLRGTFATAIGASTAIHSGQRPRARRWAQQLYLAYPKVDGILYCSSMYGNEPAIALFERGQRAIPKRPIFHRELKDPVMANILTETAKKIRYELI
ncbi:RES family NAD+ phosphorylase [Aestuariicella sp. G3-2]|uniref:RES family NAD+ phosphorylase n=1 Tax=Pseudomaricurvus albidus TaxID=2842452 RepID=UPI001C0B3773|nr:RES family NAD+ phosphorylase [Aestuariicella albida]MBU3071383.1 RES family NAD+ phosphorylase [Aestuariicella albida]